MHCPDYIRFTLHLHQCASLLHLLLTVCIIGSTPQQLCYQASLSLDAKHRPQTTHLHQALSWTAVSIFSQLHLKPVASISFFISLFHVLFDRPIALYTISRSLKIVTMSGQCVICHVNVRS